MGISMLRATGRLFVPVVAVALLAGVSLEAGAAGDRGKLRLQLGPSGADTSHVANRFVYQNTQGQLGPQETFGVADKCLLVQQTNPAHDLLNLSAAGPGTTVNGALGIGPDSIGVFDGPKGVACYRITGAIGERVSVALASNLPNEANAFDRLELDMEVKGNASFELDVYLNQFYVRTYTLRSGSSVIAGQGTSGDSHPGSRIYNCPASSDSGPDSGPSDNCRWQINDVGTSFTLRPTAGEGSLEGGGDFASIGQSFSNNTILFLTKLDIGALGCGSSNNSTLVVGDGINGASCQVSRFNTAQLPNGAFACNTPVGYAFRSFGGLGEAGCELFKSPNEQMAASIQIAFPLEPRTNLGAESKTKIYFNDGLGGTVEFTPERCVGTVITDSNNVDTIQEVLGPAPNVGYDVVPGGLKDWACILNQDVRYDGPLVSPQQQVIQTILFWGDISFSRGGSN